MDLVIDGRSTRWTAHREQRRAEFAAAAIAETAENGPVSTVDQIAERAGATRTKVYRQFKDADDLRSAVMDQLAADLKAEIEPLWLGRGTPLQIVREVLDATVAFRMRHANTIAFAGRAESARSAALGITTSLAVMFAERLAFFGIDSEVAEPLAHGIVGMVDAVTDRLTPDSDIETTVDLLTKWTWSLLDMTLRSGGIELPASEPLGGLFDALGLAP